MKSKKPEKNKLLLLGVILLGVTVGGFVAYDIATVSNKEVLKAYGCESKRDPAEDNLKFCRNPAFYRQLYGSKKPPQYDQ